MVHLYRLMRLALLLVLSSPLFAVASVPAVTTYQAMAGATKIGAPSTSFAGACAEASAYKSAHQTTPECNYGQTMCTFSPLVEDGTCYTVYNPGGFRVQWAISSELACPAGSTSVGGQCQCTAPLVETGAGECKAPSCPTGQHEEGGACVPDACQPDETRVNGVCVKPPPCPAGQTRVNGKCVRDKCPKAGTSAGDGWEMSSRATEYSCEDTGVSFDGAVQYCMIKVKNTMDISYNGKTFYYGSGTYTGGQCSGGTGGSDGPGSTPGDGGGTGPGTGPGDPGTGTGGTGGGGTGPKPPDPNNPPPPPPPPVPPGPDNHCPPGTQRYSNGNCYAPTPPPTPPNENGMCPPGTSKVNGVCVSPSPPGEPAPEPPNGDGTCPPGFHSVSNGAACVKDPAPPGGDGQCPVGTNMVNGQCVWNGGVTPPGGGDGDGGGEDDGSGFGGSCVAGFSCEGDAIQCAIAQEQHRRSCKLFDDTSPESDLYNANKGKTGNQTGDLPGNETISLSGRIDTSDAIGGGGCFGDLSVTVWGSSISLPLSNLCQYLAMLGNILVAVSMLMAARIVTRG